MTIQGTVVDESGEQQQGVEVFIPALRVSTMTGDDGTYNMLVPAARTAGVVSVTLVARKIGLRAAQRNIPIVVGGSARHDFTLAEDAFELDAVVVTGQGLQEERKKLGTIISTVKAREIEYASEFDIVSAIAGKAPNVEITSSTGDPGGGTYIRIRGSKSVEGGTQPLLVVDGQPITNETHSLGFTGSGVTNQNRAADLNPEDIESVEILKGPAATGIYGSRASNGVVLITTKSGERNSTRYSLKSSFGIDRVNNLPVLQTSYGQGQKDLDAPTVNLSPTSSISWGPQLDASTPTYDHAGEMFETGRRWDNNLTLAGGTERTTYYMSLGYLYFNGAIVGNSDYKRMTTRLKGTHDFLSNLTIGGNFSYVTSNANLVQMGSNISGMLLGAFRTPPEFNNLPYLDPETGLHRSYRYPNPTELVRGRGYDNPFWVANEMPNTSDVDRFMGNINLDWAPFNYLSFRWILGADFSNDQRVTVFPKSSSEQPVGRVDRAEFVDNVFDHSLLATFDWEFNPDFLINVTAGQNLNQTEYRRYQVTGENLIFGTDQLDFAIDRVPDEYTESIRTEGFFLDAGLDLWDQLFLKGGVRLDGSNTFGGDTTATGERESSRFWYPKASLAWEFSRYLPAFDFAKLRAAYGVAGRQPPPYSNVNAFQTGTFGDGWVPGIESIYAGFDGVYSENTLGNKNILPETTTEIEGGLDFAFLNNKVFVEATYYWQKTEDAILGLNVTPSTGFGQTWANGAEWRNWGYELTLDWRVYETDNFAFRLGAQWAKNESEVDALIGTEEESLAGFSSLTSSVVAPDTLSNGEVIKHPFGTFYGSDFVRFGRGILVDGADIDATYSGWSAGDLYIDDDGFPIEEPQSRAVGDPNPDWTGSLRATITLYNNVRLSGLLDVKHGGDIWNGTKGALFYFGKHMETIPIHEGRDTTFATCADCGPGAGTAAEMDHYWALSGPGSGFTGPSAQFVERAGFVKLRDVSVATTLRGNWLRSIGFDELDVTVSGRNLVTWTDYTGLDPEANLTGQSTGRGLEYFNHPQTRTFVFTLTLRR
jgi:TonB-linked SusC/RagA family outer membrane protein